MVGLYLSCFLLFFFSSRRRHTRLQGDWSSDVCSSDLPKPELRDGVVRRAGFGARRLERLVGSEATDLRALVVRSVRDIDRKTKPVRGRLFNRCSSTRTGLCSFVESIFEAQVRRKAARRSPALLGRARSAGRTAHICFTEKGSPGSTPDAQVLEHHLSKMGPAQS